MLHYEKLSKTTHLHLYFSDATVDNKKIGSFPLLKEMREKKKKRTKDIERNEVENKWKTKQLMKEKD